MAPWRPCTAKGEIPDEVFRPLHLEFWQCQDRFQSLHAGHVGDKAVLWWNHRQIRQIRCSIDDLSKYYQATGAKRARTE